MPMESLSTCYRVQKSCMYVLSRQLTWPAMVCEPTFHGRQLRSRALCSSEVLDDGTMRSKSWWTRELGWATKKPPTNAMTSWRGCITDEEMPTEPLCSVHNSGWRYAHRIISLQDKLTSQTVLLAPKHSMVRACWHMNWFACFRLVKQQPTSAKLQCLAVHTCCNVPGAARRGEARTTDGHCLIARTEDTILYIHVRVHLSTMAFYGSVRGTSICKYVVRSPTGPL